MFWCCALCRSTSFQKHTLFTGLRWCWRSSRVFQEHVSQSHFLFCTKWPSFNELLLMTWRILSSDELYFVLLLSEFITGKTQMLVGFTFSEERERKACADRAAAVWNIKQNHKSPVERSTESNICVTAHCKCNVKKKKRKKKKHNESRNLPFL